MGCDKASWKRSPWEHGKIPKKDIIEDLEDILELKEKQLLWAAGYLIDRPVGEEDKADVFAELKLQHLQRLAEIAEQLLAKSGLQGNVSHLQRLGGVGLPGAQSYRKKTSRCIICCTPRRARPRPLNNAEKREAKARICL